MSCVTQIFVDFYNFVHVQVHFITWSVSLILESTLITIIDKFNGFADGSLNLKMVFIKKLFVNT